ncbi:hypothetical protein Tco_0703115 [Tanacetum coccineum]|uniref:Secreted protein n=1 Tax=Tanacetum coccineum TaxID=301880 RepID=A0ABQ4XY26_9ASTR
MAAEVVASVAMVLMLVSVGRWYEGGGDVDVVMMLVDGGDDRGGAGDAWCGDDDDGVVMKVVAWLQWWRWVRRSLAGVAPEKLEYICVVARVRKWYNPN